MARKTKTITINKGRDTGKKFLITEMPVIQADSWAQKALFAAAKGGLITEIAEGAGMVDIPTLMRSIGSIDTQVGSELLDGLLDCVQTIPSGGEPRELLIDSDIEEASTLWVLRQEALKIHIDFLPQGEPQNLSQQGSPQN